MNTEPGFEELLKRNSENRGSLAESFLHAERVMIIAPHPDDEVLGCGGMILRYLREGAAVSIIYLTDGRYGLARTGEGRRKAEALSIRSLVPGVRQEFHDLEDSRLDARVDLVTDIFSRALREYIPDVVFTPWLFDLHPDHRAASSCLAGALAAIRRECVVACYEIMTPLPCGYTVDITEHQDMKNKLIDLYASQVTLFNIKNIVNSLNGYRAALCRRKQVEAAECFFLTNPGMLSRLLQHRA